MRPRVRTRFIHACAAALDCPSAAASSNARMHDAPCDRIVVSETDRIPHDVAIASTGGSREDIWAPPIARHHGHLGMASTPPLGCVRAPTPHSSSSHTRRPPTRSRSSTLCCCCARGARFACGVKSPTQPTEAAARDVCPSRPCGRSRGAFLHGIARADGIPVISVRRPRRILRHRWRGHHRRA